MSKKVHKINFSFNGHDNCAVEQDATGYKWYYMDNLDSPMEPAHIPVAFKFVADNLMKAYNDASTGRGL